MITAGERPNPNVSYAPGYNASTPVSQITPWILTLDLDFTLTTPGKRGCTRATLKAVPRVQASRWLHS
jgi:hypothetical protein